MSWWQQLLLVLAVLGGPLTLAMGLIWFERRLLAGFQERYGPNRVGPFGLLQPLADVIKLFTKEDWVPPFADRALFVAAPGIVVVTLLAVFAVIPFGPGIVIADSSVGLLFFFAMASLQVYGIVLAGWASNSKYALIGGLRGAAQMVSYELAMGLSLAGVIMLAGSFRLSDIVEAQRAVWFAVLQPVGLAIFFVAALAETRRIPFDLPEAEAEIVAGYHTEYSSMKFALFFLGEYLDISLISCLVAVLFLGGWLGPWLPGPVWLALKIGACLALFVWIRSILPRYRFDQLMRLGWKVLLPLAFANLLVTAAVILATSK